MNADRLATLEVCGVTIDTETDLIQAGLAAPPLVLGSVAIADPDTGDVVGECLSRRDVMLTFEAVIRDRSKILIGANLPYDVLVLANEAAKEGRDLFPDICQMYEDDRAWDILTQQALNAVADGMLGKDPRTQMPMRDPISGSPSNRYSLAITHYQLTNRADAKANDIYRQSYHQFHGVPIADLPPAARDYPVDDARNTHEDAFAQAGILPRALEHEWIAGAAPYCGHCRAPMMMAGGANREPCMRLRQQRNIHDLANQCRAAFAMAVGAAWGFRVNQARVDAVEARVLERRAKVAQSFLDAGILKYKKEKGIQKIGSSQSSIARRVAIAYGATLPCIPCEGGGKVPSTKTKGMINCTECAASGFDLSTIPHLPRTPTGRIACNDDVLEESGDELLMSFASEYNGEKKTTSVYVPYLRRAKHAITGADIPLTLWPNVLLETGRTSYGGSIHQFPRAGGLRECIEARPGYVLSSSDYEMGELVTHAESCLLLVGHSQLARALLANVKPHHALGATMIGEDYRRFVERFDKKDKQCKDARQAAKPGNFGFPGGMGASKLVLQQRKQGPDTACPNGPVVIDKKGTRGYRGLRFCVYMDGAEVCGGPGNMVTEWGKAGYEQPIPPTCRKCLMCAERLRTHWFATWPENRDYFKLVSDFVKNGQLLADGTRLAPGEVMQHYSNRIRGGVEFTSGANGYFQALLAEAAKEAFWQVQRECLDITYRVPLLMHANSRPSRFAGGPSPLIGSRAIALQHDEIMAEHPRAIAHEASIRVGEVMVDKLRKYCPHVADAAHVDPALMLWWWKGATKVTDDAGRLAPWWPCHDDRDCPTCGAIKGAACRGTTYGGVHVARATDDKGAIASWWCGE